MKCPHVTKSELAGDEHGWCVVCLRDEVKDLKARLREARHGYRNPYITVQWEAGYRATDLRVKKWRMRHDRPSTMW